MSTYAIGDIHGCLEPLQSLVETLGVRENLQPDDTLVFVGDYVDRGPDSKGVIDYLIGLSQVQSCVFLMGNHEDMMLWWLGLQHGNDHVSLTDAAAIAGVWIYNGGDTTLDSYDPDGAYSNPSYGRPWEAIPERHIEFLKGLHHYYIDGSNLYVHAGVDPWQGLAAETPEQAVEASSDENLLWDRESFKMENNFGTIIYGHTPNKTGIRWNRREEGSPFSVGVDVGCVFGCNPLIAVRTDDWTEIRPTQEEK